MLIRREDMDPQVVDRVLAGIGASFANPNPSPEEQRIQKAERTRFQFNPKQWAPWMLSAFALGAAVAISPMLRGVDAGVASSLGIGATLLIMGLGGVGFVQMMRGFKSRLDVLHSDLLAGWLPFLDLSRAERAYCETLVLLSRPGLKVDDPTCRTILADLNQLVEQSRRLDSQRTTLSGTDNSATVSALREEHGQLSDRIERAQDPEARRHLQTSLHLCEGRMESAQAVVPAIERLEAQQELLIQTFGAIQGTLTRLDTAHTALAAPDVDDIQRRVSDIATEARATTSAVEEVLLLQRQG